jgi:hypothetical protein
MQSSQGGIDKHDQRDWAMFTSTILLLSAASRLARDELDALISAGTNHDPHVDELRRAHSGVAALGTIADHVEEGDGS